MFQSAHLEGAEDARVGGGVGVLLTGRESVSEGLQVPQALKDGYLGLP